MTGTLRRRRRARIAGSVIGFALIGLAVWWVVRDERVSGAVGEVFKLGNAGNMRQLGLLGALSGVTLATIAMAFWVLTARYGPVGKREMVALIFSAAVLNYLPLWPGMVGRFAYHKKVHGIDIRDSARALIWANVVSLIGAVALALALVPIALMGEAPAWLLHGATAGVLVGFVMITAYAHRKRPEPEPEVWRMLCALSIRYAELFLWAARYVICFELVGSDMSWAGGLALGALTRFATMVPIAPNGMGVREWSVGLIGPILPGAMTGSEIDVATALAADVINRAADVLVIVPVGVVSAVWLARRVRQEGRRHQGSGTGQ